MFYCNFGRNPDRNLLNDLNQLKLKDDFEAKENEMKMAKISYEAAIDQVCHLLQICLI